MHLNRSTCMRWFPGYLKSQAVDIGSRIKKGEVLAEINVPRDAKARDEAAALVAQAKAQVNQAEARIKMAEAQREAAEAAITVAEADLDRLAARRVFAEKQYARVNCSGCRTRGRRQACRRADERPRGGGRRRADRLRRRSSMPRQSSLAAVAAVDQARADAAEAQGEPGSRRGAVGASEGQPRITPRSSRPSMGS